jgi:hypothetical protein
MHEPGRAWLCDDCGEAGAIRDAHRRAVLRGGLLGAAALALVLGAVFLARTWLAGRPHDPVAPHSLDE